MDGLPADLSTTVISTVALAASLGAIGFLAAWRRACNRLSDAQAQLADLKERESRLARSQTFGNIGTWDWRIDSDDLHWSDEVYGMFGHAPGSITPRYSTFYEHVHPDDRQRLRAAESVCINGSGIHDEEYRILHTDGSVRWLRETGDVIYDEHGTPVRMMGIVRDITRDKTAERSILHMAYHDDLTGLPNRLAFDARLRDAMARADRHGTLVGLAFIDLDRFKPVNDTYGHAVGDSVLKHASAGLQRASRTTDFVARVGGDEFAAILEDLSDATEIGPVLVRLHAEVRRPVAMDNGLTCAVGASIGVALYPSHATTAEDLLHRADEAMYAAKRTPELDSVIYEPAPSPSLASRI